MNHRMPEDHNCDFDFKSNGKQELEKNNPKIIGNKFVKI